MEGHHLILGTTRCILTGKTIEDTHDNRYRQALISLLLTQRGFAPHEIAANIPLPIACEGRSATIPMDAIVTIAKIPRLLIRYGPGSIVTRRQPAIAAARLIGTPYVVATNGEDAELLDAQSGKPVGTGLSAIPSRDRILAMTLAAPPPASEQTKALSHRILYAFEVNDRCPCDTTICKNPSGDLP